MESLWDETLRVVAALNEAGVAYVVVGGVAMNVHGLLRATEDLDLFVEPTPENVGRLKDALRTVWDDPCIDEIDAGDLCGDYPAVRYGPPTGELYLDILTRLGDFARFEDLKWQTISAEGTPFRVATPETLHWMKKSTVRPLDHADARRLQEAFGLEESG